jgi:hypothetical protein
MTDLARVLPITVTLARLTIDDADAQLGALLSKGRAAVRSCSLTGRATIVAATPTATIRRRQAADQAVDRRRGSARDRNQLPSRRWRSPELAGK